MYCLFCDVLCIVCVYMCTELLPPGGYPIAVKYIISYRIISYKSTPSSILGNSIPLSWPKQSLQSCQLTKIFFLKPEKLFHSSISKRSKVAIFHSARASVSSDLETSWSEVWITHHHRNIRFDSPPDNNIDSLLDCLFCNSDGQYREICQVGNGMSGGVTYLSDKTWAWCSALFTVNTEHTSQTARHIFNAFEPTLQSPWRISLLVLLTSKNMRLGLLAIHYIYLHTKFFK